MSVAAAVAGPVIAAGSVLVGGLHRNFLLVRPSKPPLEGRLPLVLVLHGHMGSASRALGLWPKLAERENILVAAPEGLKGSDHQRGWNDCRADAVYNPKRDDVAFLNALARRMIREERADPKRIYVTGMSNGAMMTLRAALEMRPQPAAVAAVSGLMAANSSCAGGRPVSVMLVAGTADPIVPYRGGPVGKGFWPQDRGTVVSAADSAEFWRRADSLPAEPKTEKLAHQNYGDPTSVTRTTWGAEPSKLQVELVTIEGGGHVEPSREVSAGFLYRAYAGRQNRDFETAEEAWTFFKDKRAP